MMFAGLLLLTNWRHIEGSSWDYLMF